MGLFNRKKKEDKKAKWNINKLSGDVEVCDKYLRITQITRSEYIVFYQDIIQVSKKNDRKIEVKTKVDEFDIYPANLRGGADNVQELYLALLEKVAEYK